MAIGILAVLVIFGAGTGCRTQAQNPIRFLREEVAMNIKPGLCEVRGNYHFGCRAKNPLRVIMLYPFPIDSSHLYPDSVALGDRVFTRCDSGVKFELVLRPGAEDSVTVYYRQPITGRSACYIVTTARQWQEPISLARFAVTVPLELNQASPNFQPDSVIRTDSTATLFFARKQFFPSRDLVVTW